MESHTVANIVSEYLDAGTFGALIVSNRAMNSALHVLRKDAADKKIKAVLGEEFIEKCKEWGLWKGVLVTAAGIDATVIGFLRSYREDPNKVMCAVISFILDRMKGWNNESIFDIVIKPVLHPTFQYITWGHVLKTFIEWHIKTIFQMFHERTRAFYMGMYFFNKLVDYSIENHGRFDMTASVIVRCRLLRVTRSKLAVAIKSIQNAPHLYQGYDTELQLFKTLHKKLGTWIKMVAPLPSTINGKRVMEGPNGGLYYIVKKRKIYLNLDEIARNV